MMHGKSRLAEFQLLGLCHDVVADSSGVYVYVVGRTSANLPSQDNLGSNDAFIHEVRPGRQTGGEFWRCGSFLPVCDQECHVRRGGDGGHG